MTQPTTTYSLSPSLQDFVETSQGFAPVDDSLEARRAAFVRACRHFTPTVPQGLRVEDLALGDLRLRLYHPDAPPPEGGWPTVLYLHGGGWDLGNLDSHDWFAYRLARRLPTAIVAVDYRLAPDHPFPAPLEDALAAWMALRNGELHPALSTHRLAVAGDSAGGTLAAGLCRALLERDLAQPLLQLLAYPVLSASDDLPSMTEHARTPTLTTQSLAKSLDGFLPRFAQRLNPCAMPLQAQQFEGLAAAFIGVAEFDPLRDQGHAYHRVLQQAGVPSQLHMGRGLLHASLRAQGSDEVERFYDAMGQALRLALYPTRHSHYLEQSRRCATKVIFKAGP
ncbi:alpha/beta hydrolase [Pseudomonas sp. 13B_2.1_Bac1]|uniref:alpha/beta hydrolase n=1 Tax=Pseudomonas sp. 13B_2.1_Bac1 TaxID=2971624 RepID=UPI0021C9AE19|nr:alpha/beta hydrolase [Pseudomonas sp. 13B_2.1_Bac1]MCU1785310.1 alpha/beta hydrolase [Pseudomonas sp. 13B_2.1_Bac1]